MKKTTHQGVSTSLFRAGKIHLLLDAGVKRLLLFQHDPSRSDAQLDEMMADSRECIQSYIRSQVCIPTQERGNEE